MNKNFHIVFGGRKSGKTALVAKNLPPGASVHHAQEAEPEKLKGSIRHLEHVGIGPYL